MSTARADAIRALGARSIRARRATPRSHAAQRCAGHLRSRISPADGEACGDPITAGRSRAGRRAASGLMVPVTVPILAGA
jgi:hypothetical protein